jgi:quinol monooxygenase YgiN
MKELGMAMWQKKLMGSRETRDGSRFNLAQKFFASTVLTLLLINFNAAFAVEQQIMVRISEIQVDANHLEQYKAILQEEAEASVRLEPGVIAIFPMYHRESDTEFRILEIYADREAYEAHLKTPHFQKYKSSTLHMVKSLKLVEMQTIEAKTMSKMFKKMKSRQ